MHLVQPYGSFVSGLYTPDGDLDITIEGDLKRCVHVSRDVALGAAAATRCTALLVAEPADMHWAVPPHLFCDAGQQWKQCRFTWWTLRCASSC